MSENGEQDGDAALGGRVIELNPETMERLRTKLGSAPPELGDQQPEGYVPSEDVAVIARRVIGSDPRFEVCTDIRIGYALLWGEDPGAHGGIHALAKCVKAPRLWRDLGDFEVVIFAVEKAWRHLSERQREALIAHELNHVGGRGESGSVFLLEHDVEEFSWVVGHYGQWHGGLEHFAQQLNLGIPKR